MNALLVRDLTELHAHEAAWQALYDRIAQASIFASPTWVLNWLRSFTLPDSLRCILVYDSEGLQAVLPLVRLATRWRRVPVVALCACTNAHSVRNTWLYPAERKSSVLATALELIHRMGQWDMLLLDGCVAAPASVALPVIPAEQPIENWCHSYLAIQGSWSDYLSHRSRDLRRNLRRTAEGLGAQGVLEFELLGQDADELMRYWVAVDQASWKAQAGEVVDSNAQTEGYYHGLLKEFTSHQQLLAGLLLRDRTPIAIIVCVHDKGVCYTLKTAMRQDYASAKLSTGALVMSKLLEQLWTHPSIRYVDFVSKQPYTDRWTSDVQWFSRHILFARTWRGILLRSIEALVRWAAALRHAAKANL